MLTRLKSESPYCEHPPSRRRGYQQQGLIGSFQTPDNLRQHSDQHSSSWQVQIAPPRHVKPHLSCIEKQVVLNKGNANWLEQDPFTPHLQRNFESTSKGFQVCWYLSRENRPLFTNAITSDATPRAVYASYVVPQTLKSSPPAWYWYGATTSIVRFVDIFGFRTAWVSDLALTSEIKVTKHVSIRITYCGLSFI